MNDRLLVHWHRELRIERRGTWSHRSPHLLHQGEMMIAPFAALVLTASDPGFPDAISTTSVIVLLTVCITAVVRGWVLLPRELDSCQTALAEQRELNEKIERDRDEWQRIATTFADQLKSIAITVKETR